MDKTELTVTIEPERLDALRYFLSAREKARRSGSCSVRWRNSMKSMFPPRCGSIWTASADRLPGPAPDVRRRTAIRCLPGVRTVQRRRFSHERRL